VARASALFTPRAPHCRWRGKAREIADEIDVPVEQV
jgi:hypothetical protein